MTHQITVADGLWELPGPHINRTPAILKGTTMTYKDEIEAIVGASVKIHYQRIESFMSKTQEEGHWAIICPTAEPMEKRLIATFSLVCMPGCCGIAIATGAKVYGDYQRRGLGTLLNKMRQAMAYRLGYSVLMCTDRVANTPQQAILQKNKWTRVWAFINYRTTNEVSVDMIDLGPNNSDALGFAMYGDK